ncbi:AAA family ATPase [Actinomadura sp. 9N407]|uniref:AAA family ATPase n=1 Tax=Actinomadura sp. 9N407 TaxID=3375154 RepID=UPI0037B604AA
MIRELKKAEPEAGAGAELRFPAGSLVLVAGLPGAGKSTLLERLYRLGGEETAPVAIDGGFVIDSRQARNRWSHRLRLVPARARVPLVNATHVWWIARAVRRGEGVVAHTRGTWPHILRMFSWLAARHGGQVHLVLIDVDPRTALEGQRARGRVVATMTFARHCRRWHPLLERARDGAVPPAATVTLLSRTEVDALTAIRFR